MNASFFSQKYSSSSKFSGAPKKEINSTHKFVEYTLDIIDMRNLLLKVSFDEKWNLMEAIKIAERKRDWHYNQDNFNLATANTIIGAVSSQF